LFGNPVANARERLSFLSPEDLSRMPGGMAGRTFWRGTAAAD
jgi:hypothetical protein